MAGIIGLSIKTSLGWAGPSSVQAEIVVRLKLNQSDLLSKCVSEAYLSRAIITLSLINILYHG